MEEKKIIYDIILTVWNLVKDSFFKPMSSEMQVQLNTKAMEKELHFKTYGDTYQYLFSEIWVAFIRFYERKSKNDK